MGPIHPALVHFPIALTLASVAIDVYGAATKNAVARVVGFWTLVAATLGANAAVIAGLYDMEKAKGHVDLVHVHMWLGLSLLVVLFAATLWRLRLYRRGGGVGAYAVVAPAIALGIVVQGWLGGELVYANGVGVAVKAGAGEHDGGGGHGRDGGAAASPTRGVGEGEHEAGGAVGGRAAGRGHGGAQDAQPSAAAGPAHDPAGAHGAQPGASAAPARAEEPGVPTNAASRAHAQRAPMADDGGTTRASPGRPETEPSSATSGDDQATPLPPPRATVAPQRLHMTGTRWPVGSADDRARGPTHPASPRAPAAPLYPLPRALSAAPLFPVDAPTEADDRAPPAAAPVGHEGMGHP